MPNNNIPNMNNIFSQPKAVAHIEGSSDYPQISGDVWFYENANGVIVVANIEGLPMQKGNCSSPIFAFHIHEGSSCSGNMQDPFSNAMTHYNPLNCPHPYHAGDLPPLFGAMGKAFSAVLTDRFFLSDVIGKTIIIHSLPDDFTTQPSGNSGTKIACGVIKYL